MNDLSRGMMFIPRDTEAVHALWRETDFKYRNWLKDESAKVWANAPTFKPPNAN